VWLKNVEIATDCLNPSKNENDETLKENAQTN
jgi:hypothetical protein